MINQLSISDIGDGFWKWPCFQHILVLAFQEWYFFQFYHRTSKWVISNSHIYTSRNFRHEHEVQLKILVCSLIAYLLEVYGKNSRLSRFRLRPMPFCDVARTGEHIGETLLLGCHWMGSVRKHLENPLGSTKVKKLERQLASFCPKSNVKNY